MIAGDIVRGAKRIAVGALACLLAGCATHAMTPTPAVYTDPNARPLFADASLESRQSELDLLFLTDRAPADGTGGSSPYRPSARVDCVRVGCDRVYGRKNRSGLAQPRSSVAFPQYRNRSRRLRRNAAFT